MKNQVGLILCVIEIFTKYACIKPLNHKKAITVLHSFIEIVNKSKQPNKLWVDSWWIEEENFVMNLCKNG